jgi:hypothetical protein
MPSSHSPIQLPGRPIGAAGRSGASALSRRDIQWPDRPSCAAGRSGAIPSSRPRRPGILGRCSWGAELSAKSYLTDSFWSPWEQSFDGAAPPAPIGFYD